ncbi:glutathione peroxidase 1-like [Callithrix jacchus]
MSWAAAVAAQSVYAFLARPAGQRGSCEPGFLLDKVAAAAAQSVYTFLARPLAGSEPVSLDSLRDKFGHQENAKNEEILNSLKYVRPGGGFEPNFMLFEKCEVNGAGLYPLFAFLREALPAPSDDATELMTDPKLITWSLVCRNDVAWNFEKFLVGPDSVPVRRYSRRFQTIDIEPDIEALLSQGPSCA